MYTALAEKPASKLVYKWTWNLLVLMIARILKTVILLHQLTMLSPHWWFVVCDWFFFWISSLPIRIITPKSFYASAVACRCITHLPLKNTYYRLLEKRTIENQSFDLCQTSLSIVNFFQSCIFFLVKQHVYSFGYRMDRQHQKNLIQMIILHWY